GIEELHREAAGVLGAQEHRRADVLREVRGRRFLLEGLVPQPLPVVDVLYDLGVGVRDAAELPFPFGLVLVHGSLLDGGRPRLRRLARHGFDHAQRESHGEDELHAGKTSTTVVPLPSLESRRTEPPWARMAWSTKGRPRPQPSTCPVNFSSTW